MYYYFKVYKPFGYLSQFTKEHESHKTLAELYDFPKDVYPIGRLDKDSEGLLLLSNDKKVVDKLLNPKYKLEKKYWVQVEGIPSKNALQELRLGVEIKIKTGKYHRTLPAKVETILAPNLPDRHPPIRVRINIPTTWLEICITEGKNRQVRKMLAKVGYPVLRLTRISVGKININGMKTGEVVKLQNLTV